MLLLHNQIINVYYMANFLEIKVPVKRDEKWSDWARMMRTIIKSAGIPVRWQMFHYHMTLMFLNDDNCVDDLNQGFCKFMSEYSSLSLSVDKLDAFTTGDGNCHIIYLTSTKVPSQIHTLAQNVRILADSLNVNYDKRPFKPHITLGRVPTDKISLDQLQAVLRTIEQPTFNSILNETEYRYFRGKVINTWKLNNVI